MYAIGDVSEEMLKEAEDYSENIKKMSFRQKRLKKYELRKENQKNDIIKDELKDKTEITELQKYYRKKRYITTQNELNMYRKLLNICKKYNLILLTQVALYEIIEVNLPKDNKDYIKYFNKIKSKTIDFVIVDEDTTRIRLCIELDDYTHNYKNRIIRDEFINNLFKDLDISILRITSKQDIEELEKYIKIICTDEVYSKE